MSQERLVRNFMTTGVTTLPPNARLLDAVLTLRRTGFRHIPIVEADRLVGIVTDRDIQRFAPSLLSNLTPEQYNEIFENTALDRVMTKDPLTVAPGTRVEEAVNILFEKKLGCLPVVENSKLVGIVTVTDMLKLLHDLLTGAAPSNPAAP